MHSPELSSEGRFVWPLIELGAVCMCVCMLMASQCLLVLLYRRRASQCLCPPQQTQRIYYPAIELLCSLTPDASATCLLCHVRVCTCFMWCDHSISIATWGMMCLLATYTTCVLQPEAGAFVFSVFLLEGVLCQSHHTSFVKCRLNGGWVRVQYYCSWLKKIRAV